MRQRKERVYCLMSGGVDSAVAAYLLQKMGYEVIGITLLIWGKREREGTCCGARAIQDARTCAQQIKIPHYTIDLREEFQRLVIEEFLDAYIAGKTPNPCILCNQKIKFAKVIEKIDKLFPGELGYIATGHYARIEDGGLKKAKFPQYDQSYFLYAIPKENLKRIIFPLGEYSKEMVREIARKVNLLVAEKKKSQEICFIPDKEYANFILQYYPDAAKPGPIFSKEGEVIGKHKGIIYYTIGQRKRISIARGKRLYVISYNPLNNGLIVGEEEDVYGMRARVSPLNLFTEIKDGMRVRAKIRHQDKESWARLRWEKEEIILEFEEPKWAITPGQSAVFYEGEKVLGGGVIVSAQ
uniref:tRNA-specific 2-thiouridylase MnmA n=1 Tax=candidate division WOR-3 bacterium TaxID=2052148 RepID=A0A7C3Z1R4_UNCW3